MTDTGLGHRDEEVRAAAIAFVDQRSVASGGLITRADLESFTFEGIPLPLIEMQKGIRKPAGFDVALTFLTTYVRDPSMAPYEDVVGDDGYLRYKWQGDNPDLAVNRGLREAWIQGKPLVYLRGVGKGTFVAQTVWIVDEEPASQQFVVALEHDLANQWTSVNQPIDLPLRRQYAEYIAKRRLFQREFRGRVLLAYEKQCALCRLRHTELLDAAHLRADSAGGEPVVPNGVAMCAIHHRAFDSNFLGITPTYKIVVRRDIMEESDGPTLKFTLQGINGQQLALPSQTSAQPDPLLLEERYEQFRSAS